jgi:hypothetical protein
VDIPARVKNVSQRIDKRNRQGKAKTGKRSGQEPEEYK